VANAELDGVAVNGAIPVVDDGPSPAEGRRRAEGKRLATIPDGAVDLPWRRQLLEQKPGRSEFG